MSLTSSASRTVSPSAARAAAAGLVHAISRLSYAPKTPSRASDARW